MTRTTCASCSTELGGRLDREARFVCCLCLILPGAARSRWCGRQRQRRLPAGRGGRLHARDGHRCAARSSDGFGYDPVFQPDGWESTLAEASPEARTGYRTGGLRPAPFSHVLLRGHNTMDLEAFADSGVGSHRLTARGVPGTPRERAGGHRGVAFSPDDLATVGLSPGDRRTLLGLYHGVPLTERGAYYMAFPDRITIYQKPIEAMAGPDEENIREHVRHTVIHEIAHYYGIDDDRLEELGGVLDRSSGLRARRAGHLQQQTAVGRSHAPGEVGKLPGLGVLFGHIFETELLRLEKGILLVERSVVEQFAGGHSQGVGNGLDDVGGGVLAALLNVAQVAL